MKTKVTKIVITTWLLTAPLAGLLAQQKLTLQDAVALAKERNSSVKESVLEIQRAHELKNITRSLFLPTVGLTGQVNHYFDRTPFFGFGEENTGEKIPYGRFGGEDQAFAAITAVQPIFNPTAGPALGDSRLRIEQSEIGLQRSIVETLSSVKETYLTVLVLNERLKLQRETIRRNERVLKNARSLFLQGKALRVDTLIAYTAVKNQEPLVLRLQYAIETGELRLKNLIGLDSAKHIELSDSLFVPGLEPDPSEDRVFQAARNESPDLRLIDLDEKIASQQIAIAKASRLPSLSAVGQYQLQTQTNDFDYGDASYPSSSYVGLQLAIPLFNGLARQSQIREARISHERTAIHSRDVENKLKATVHEHVARLRESRERLATTAGVKETAQISYDIIEYRYKKGISSRLELAEAELELSTAQSSYLEAVYDYFSSQIALDKLMGAEN